MSELSDRVALEKLGLEQGWAFLNEGTQTTFARGDFTLRAFWSEADSITGAWLTITGRKVAGEGMEGRALERAREWLHRPSAGDR